MRLKDVHRLELPPTADMHVHLRQDQVMELVVPWIRRGGVDTVFVMPNLQPPITSAAAALEYKSRLQAIEPRVNYLMSLYLHSSVTPEVIAEAAKAGIAGVKLYPQGKARVKQRIAIWAYHINTISGVTTNSESGVAGDFVEVFAPTFAAMEQYDLVLNLHGEVPGTVPDSDVSLEELFLPTLKRLNEKFPKLRIILEHCSTAAALDAVRACGPTVAGTITAHHLYLTGDISEVDPLAFCKPIPKTPSDRDALLKAVCSGDPKFFFGSDSAPHPLVSKQGKPVPAGVFTQPYATQLVLLALEEATGKGIIDEQEVTQEHLEGFLSLFGRRFYKLPEPSVKGPRIVVKRTGEMIPISIKTADGTLEIGLSRPEATVFSLRFASEE
ncbi:Dihydroorotase [Xylariaceae sp. FL1651]|nr:Dihydroorotase [Xylariaceae sp. FL1651]